MSGTPSRDTAASLGDMTEVADFAIRFLADPPGKPPLLLVHGFLSSRHHWLPNIGSLRTHFRIILAELPGHGDTGGCTDPKALHPDALVAALDAGRAAIDIPHWHICGQSFGAGLTLRYALRHPERVMAQVWTNANRTMATPWSSAESAGHQRRRNALAADGVAALRREPFHPRFAKRFPEDLRALLADDADRCDIPTIVALLDHATPELPVQALFGSLKVPKAAVPRDKPL